MVREGERIDDLQNGYSVIQHKDDFCFGSDAVMLAHFATVKHKARVMDLCTGSGVIPILLCAHTDASYISGVEIQPTVAERAVRSVLLNNLSERIEIRELDLKQAPDEYGAASFDTVTCNPPYGKAGASYPTESQSKRIARHEVLCTLEDCVKAASALVKNGGRVAFVVPPLRAFELAGLYERYRLTPKRLQTVSPTPFAPPSIVMIEGVKGGKQGLAWLAPIIMKDQNGNTTERVREIYGEKSGD